MGSISILFANKAVKRKNLAGARIQTWGCGMKARILPLCFAAPTRFFNISFRGRGLMSQLLDRKMQKWPCRQCCQLFQVLRVGQVQRRRGSKDPEMSVLLQRHPEVAGGRHLQLGQRDVGGQPDRWVSPPGRKANDLARWQSFYILPFPVFDALLLKR